MASHRRPSSAFDRTIICLPLLKYSWAFVNYAEKTIPWQHEQSSDLLALLEYEPHTQDASIQLRVVHATKTIETIRVSELARETQTIADILQRSQGSFTVNNLPTFAITSSQRLAFRHASAGKSKRTQFCFHSDAKCAEFVQVLKTTPLLWSQPTSKKDTITRPQTCSEPLQSSAAGSAPCFTADSAECPDSVMRPPVMSIQSVEPNLSPVLPPNATNQQWLNGTFTRNGPSYILGHPLPSSPPSISRHPSIFHDKQCEPAYRITEYDKRDDFPSLPKYADSRPDCSPGVAQLSSGMLQQLACRSDIAPSLGRQDMECSSAAKSINGRPLTAPAASSSEMLQSLLPPRRELPFSRPSDRPKETRSKLGTARPSTSSSELSTLPTPTFAEVSSSNTKRKHADEHVNRPETSDTFIQDTRVLQNQGEQSSKLFRLKTPAGPTWLPPPRSDGLSYATPRNIRQQNDLAPLLTCEDRQDRAYTSGANLSSSDAFQSSSPDRPADDGLPMLRSRPGVSNFDPTSDFRPGAGSAENDTNQARMNHRSHMSPDNNGAITSLDVDDLASYTTMPAKEREDWLNDFIYRHLEDENFLKLCVDVEGCWRRRFLDQRPV
ncbi:hypothetical protein MBLNU459_g8465t2 [Dothideomycetes sp. NU459]